MASNSNEYESAVKVLEETTGRWNKEWKVACDKFQDLEEERLDFTKSSLWAYANIASTVCVSDDASCEKIRLSLEGCEVEKDIANFIKACGTGQEIPDPPKYINFAKGDLDSASEASEDDFSVAQFQRNTKPEYRSSSPSHSVSDSNYAPQSELAQRINEGPSSSEEPLMPANANSGRPPPLNYNRQQDQNVPPNYSPSQHGDIPKIPHNQYPTEGMTMFTRAGPPSVTGSGLSAGTRPSSRDDQSEYSQPSSYTSADPMSGKSSPTKGMPAGGVELPGISSSPDKSVQKKRSGFFSNSPFRRKSKREADHHTHTPSGNRNIYNLVTNSSRMNIAPSNISSTSTQSSPTKLSAHDRPQSRSLFNRAPPPDGEEPADPRASFQLNVGNNVFDVASPDSHQSTPKASMNNHRGFPGSTPVSTINAPADDPIVQALADLKMSSNGLGMNKQASMRVQADRHLGVQTPSLDAQTPNRPTMISAQSADRLAAQRGTPPPAYDGGSRGSALGVPQPAFTSREMRSRTENWGTGSNVGGTRQSAGNLRARSPGPGIPRAASPQPQRGDFRSRSPRPGIMRARSPAPGPGQMRARSPGPDMMQQQQQTPVSRNESSSYPKFGPGGGQERRGSGMEVQLSSSDMQRYDDGGSGRSRGQMNNARPMSAYGGSFPQQPQMQQSQQQQGYDQRGRMDGQMRRERSKSMAAVGSRQGSEPGPPAGILHYGTLKIPTSCALSSEY